MTSDRVRELLPVGTIVTLKEGSKKLMIFGIIQSMQEENSAEAKEYDYIAVPYPEGNIGQDFQYLFNQQDIETVHFLGFSDIDRQQFVQNLSDFYDQQNSML